MNVHSGDTSFGEVFKASTFVKPVGSIHVDLSAAPEERWKRAMDEANRLVDIDAMISDTRRHVDDLLGLVSIVDVSSSTQSWIGIFLRSLLFSVFALICSLFCSYSADITALAVHLHIPKGELFLANVLYEAFGCTSFICADSNDPSGRPMLARTLDWPFIELAKYTLQFRWVRDDEVIFESIGWLGFVGVMTGVKQGCFAIALNARYPEIPEFEWIDNMCLYVTNDPEERKSLCYLIKSTIRKFISACSLNAWCSGSSIRYCLENCDSYSDAVGLLAKQRLIAPCYFIIAGVREKEGVNLSRDVWPMSSVPSGTMLRGYVMQTNHDHISEEHVSGLPPEDFNSIERYNCVARLLQRRKMLSATEAALILTKSMNSGVGVRMKMTLYCCILRPYHKNAPIVTSKMSRCIGQ